ncbi:uncharacterized protein C18orf63-like [Andrena cerasifolii]|uniref:uncharacterized protein C18orf63-like n=1 Tax=Andrena cerasifolii TaxID=2819439 RepID=UPI004037C314
MNTSRVVYEREENTIMYASFPNLNKLCCVMCQIDFVDVHESKTKSNFYWQTMKCRLLIHLVPKVIASPVSGTEIFIFIITDKTFFATGKLETILRTLKLVYHGVRPITKELYKMCLIYTIRSKIAPQWNRAGQYMLLGKEFYNSVQAIGAVKLDILIEENNTRLQLGVEKVKIPYLKLEEHLPSSVIAQFLLDPKGYIDLSSYKIPFVHVLPSTKKGKLLSVSKEIPASCAFTDYDQLRRHWKNMYGYSLPKNKDGILYYEIKFPIPRSNIFTYPSLCITFGSLDIIPNRDKELTITQFLSDMLVKVPIICGQQLQISKHTPFKTENSSLACATFIKSQDSCLVKENDPIRILQSGNSEIRNTNITSVSLKEQLTKIHRIHDTSVCENVAYSSNRDIDENRNDVTKTIEGGFIGGSASRNLADTFTVTKTETISRYFGVQKPYSRVNREGFQSLQKETGEHLTLKEKLSNAKSSENSRVPLQETDHNIDVEAMAKNNQLHQVRKSVLSDWLKKHLIPHDSKIKKTDLINKVLSHIRNTQMLNQFRL